MKLSRIGTRLLVRDFGACFDFYTEKLGFDVLWGDRIIKLLNTSYLCKI